MAPPLEHERDARGSRGGADSGGPPRADLNAGTLVRDTRHDLPIARNAAALPFFAERCLAPFAPPVPPEEGAPPAAPSAATAAALASVCKPAACGAPRPAASPPAPVCRATNASLVSSGGRTAPRRPCPRSAVAPTPASAPSAAPSPATPTSLAWPAPPSVKASSAKKSSPAPVAAATSSRSCRCWAEARNRDASHWLRKCSSEGSSSAPRA
mmetsp:Transcript_9221/g.29237  ORF Transcript_9221/g.29237 Transcript_9221/m.29237 type:complete len:212 (-) Transcript_9221:324-959(-)